MNYKPIISKDKYVNNVGQIGVLKTTGPIVYTKAIIPLLVKYKCRIINDNNDIGLIYNNLVPNLKKSYNKSHYKLFKRPHYTSLTTPIINN